MLKNWKGDEGNELPMMWWQGGAGPAGSVAACQFARAGFSVLLVEKRQEIGAPVRCAEAIGSETTVLSSNPMNAGSTPIFLTTKYSAPLAAA
ncbi:MAG: NAD(P)-binding protein [Anaerolineae bacterium]